MTRRQRHAAAFSLAELLVVISLFCLLAAMFLPTFPRVVAIARRVHCAENLRSVASAYEAHAAVAASGDLPPLEALRHSWEATLRLSPAPKTKAQNCSSPT